MKRAMLSLVAVLGCRGDSGVVDRGGRSLEVPVPSRGIAAAPTANERYELTLPERPKQDPRALDTRDGPYGAYLVDGGGRALYTFSGDTREQTACLTNCAVVWPPMIVKSEPALKGAALDPTKLGAIPRPDGAQQVTYGGLPLYYSESDLKAGDTWGHYAMSFGGRFSLIGPDGKPLPGPR